MEQKPNGSESWEQPGTTRSLGQFACDAWRRIRFWLDGCDELGARVYDRQMAKIDPDEVRDLGELMTKDVLYYDEVERALDEGR